MFFSLRIFFFVAACCALAAGLHCPPDRLKNKVMLNMHIAGQRVTICSEIGADQRTDYPKITSNHLEGDFLMVLTNYPEDCTRPAAVFSVEKLRLQNGDTTVLDRLFAFKLKPSRGGQAYFALMTEPHPRYLALLYPYKDGMAYPKRHYPFFSDQFESKIKAAPVGYFAFRVKCDK